MDRSKTYKLTKSNIKTGLNCYKQLWYDVHDGITKDHFNFYKGKVFEKKLKLYTEKVTI